MADTFTTEQRSAIMSRIRSRGNVGTEVQFVRLLRKHGIRGWRRGSLLPGKPDFVFPKERIVVFIDGDFWHGNPRRFRLPKSNTTYWTQKILGNRRRDRRVNRVLKSSGWRVIRFWQSSLADEARVVRRLASDLASPAASVKKARDTAIRSRRRRAGGK